MGRYRMALCKGRHKIPMAIHGAIFDYEITNIVDTDKLEHEAYIKLKSSGCNGLDLYVTGLTVALIATINACKRLNLPVTLWHFDRETGSYFNQEVL